MQTAELIGVEHGWTAIVPGGPYGRLPQEVKLRTIKKLLVANRGEIALRIIRSARVLGLKTVAVYSEADAGAAHVAAADEARPIGPPDPASSYLNMDAIIAAATASGADAIHPGYGFLSERPEFARTTEDHGMIFVGPPAKVMAALGDKVAARRIAIEAGVPVVPGVDSGDLASARSFAASAGYPILVKAAAGGGGRGMRVVNDSAGLADSLEAAAREAQAAFGDGRVFLERLITNGRHVEVQVFGDTHGHIMHLGERDCSIQRRYQKVLEESPAPGLSQDLRHRLYAYAVALAQAATYVGPGTVEFLVEGDACYFLEMNTRLQVEHPVTELVTGLDLAKLQIEVAFGASLATRDSRLTTRIGHAIEARIYAEDPEAGFLPATGAIRRLELPNGPGIRNDAGIQLGDEIGVSFDPLLAKLIVWGADRAEVIARLCDALRRCCILGVATNLNFLLQLAEHPDFQAANLSTRFIEEHPVSSSPGVAGEAEVRAPGADVDEDLANAAQAWQCLRSSPDPFRQGWSRPESAEITPDGGLMLNGRRYYLAEDERQVEVWRRGHRAVFPKPNPPSVEQAAGSEAAAEGEHTLTSPLTGMVVKILVQEGQPVEARQTLLILEAMKMEHNVQAPFAATVRRIHVKPNTLAPTNSPLIDLAAR